MKHLAAEWSEWALIWRRDDPYHSPLDHVYFDLRDGEVHWVPGDEGAVPDAEIRQLEAEFVSPTPCRYSLKAQFLFALAVVTLNSASSTNHVSPFSLTRSLLVTLPSIHTREPWPFPHQTGGSFTRSGLTTNPDFDGHLTDQVGYANPRCRDYVPDHEHGSLVWIYSPCLSSVNFSISAEIP